MNEVLDKINEKTANPEQDMKLYLYSAVSAFGDSYYVFSELPLSSAARCNCDVHDGCLRPLEWVTSTLCSSLLC